MQYMINIICHCYCSYLTPYGYNKPPYLSINMPIILSYLLMASYLILRTRQRKKTVGNWNFQIRAKVGTTVMEALSEIIKLKVKKTPYYVIIFLNLHCRSKEHYVCYFLPYLSPYIMVCGSHRDLSQSLLPFLDLLYLSFSPSPLPNFSLFLFSLNLSLSLCLPLHLSLPLSLPLSLSLSLSLSTNLSFSLSPSLLSLSISLSFFPFFSLSLSLFLPLSLSLSLSVYLSLNVSHSLSSLSLSVSLTLCLLYLSLSLVLSHSLSPFLSS